MGMPQINPPQPIQFQPQPGYNLSSIYAPITSAPSVFSQNQLNNQLPNVQQAPPMNSLQGFLNNYLMNQNPLGSPQGSPQGQQQGGGLNNMMSFLGNMFGSGGSSIASLFGR